MRLPFRDGLFRGGVRHRAEASEATQGWEGLGAGREGDDREMVGLAIRLDAHEFG